MGIDPRLVKRGTVLRRFNNTIDGLRTPQSKELEPVVVTNTWFRHWLKGKHPSLWIKYIDPDTGRKRGDSIVLGDERYEIA